VPWKIDPPNISYRMELLRADVKGDVTKLEAKGNS
jgi:hypothetical protein